VVVEAEAKLVDEDPEVPPSELWLELLRVGISPGLPEKLVIVEVRLTTCMRCSLSSLEV